MYLFKAIFVYVRAMFTTEERKNIGEYKLTFLIFLHIKLSYGLRHLEKYYYKVLARLFYLFIFLIVCF